MDEEENIALTVADIGSLFICVRSLQHRTISAATRTREGPHAGGEARGDGGVESGVEIVTKLSAAEP